MPIYEYECKKCGILEIQQSINDEPIKLCPECEEEVNRIISVTSPPQFKGTGFYQTDYVKKT